VSVSCPQECRDEVRTLTVEDDERMVDVLLVIAVVEGAFLLSVGGICDSIKVQKYFLRSAILLPPQIEFEEDFGYYVAGASGGRILKPAHARKWPGTNPTRSPPSPATGVHRRKLCVLRQRRLGVPVELEFHNVQWV
jgi:hypothetical protein